MKKTTKILFIVIVLMIILLVPFKQIYKDGGTKTYTSLTYKIIKWNTIDGKKETNFYIFPFNFKSLDKYREKIDKEELKDLFLMTDEDIYSLNDTAINFTIVNNTNKTLYTHASPTLEIKTDTGWEVLEKNNTAGFCGNKDSINDSINMTLLLSWYDNLIEGDYRISFNIYINDMTAEADNFVSKEFSLQAIESSQKENSVNCNKNDFEMSFYTDKKLYKTTEKIKMWVTLKYIGNADSIKIWHAGSVDSDTYFGYVITDGKNFNVQSVTNTMLKSTILNKDKLYHFDYEKSGGFSADDPDADFWEKFYKEKDLLLPKGEYTITAQGAFSLFSNMKENINLICELKIKVVE